MLKNLEQDDEVGVHHLDEEELDKMKMNHDKLMEEAKLLDKKL